MKFRTLLLLPFILLVPIFAVGASPNEDRWNIELVGRESSGPATGVDIAGEYGYLCIGGALVILKIHINYCFRHA